MARLAIGLTVLLALALAAAPAAAQAQKPADVHARRERRRRAREAEARRREPGRPRAARGRSARSAKCRTKGPGWARIRKVRDPRSGTPTRAAPRTLWGEPRRGRGRRAPGSRSTRRTSSASCAASRRRCPTRSSRPASTRSASGSPSTRRAYSFGTCATFNKLMKKVREFKIGGSHGVSGDYYAGKIYNDFVRYVVAPPAGRGARALGLALRQRARGGPRPAQGARRRRGLRELLRLRLQGLSGQLRRPVAWRAWPRAASPSRGT